MKSSLLMNFSTDKENKKIIVEREFAAPIDKVWHAWTKSEILDQWWAPKPWKARTKTMEFKNGGHWLYAMVGPEGEEHWARADFSEIVAQQRYKATDAFCDESGAINDTMPQSVWSNSFRAQNKHTVVLIEITYEKLEDLEGIIQMGFKEGFTAGLANLDELFQ